MKLRNLILLPATALTAVVPALTMTSCNKGQDPEPDPEPVTPDFGEFELIESSEAWEHPIMASKKATNLSANVEYKVSVPSKYVMSDDEERFLIFYIYDANDPEETYVVFSQCDTISMKINGTSTTLMNLIHPDGENTYPAFCKVGSTTEDILFFNKDDLNGKNMNFTFKLKENFPNAKINVVYPDYI